MGARARASVRFRNAEFNYIHTIACFYTQKSIMMSVHFTAHIAASNKYGTCACAVGMCVGSSPSEDSNR